MEIAAAWLVRWKGRPPGAAEKRFFGIIRGNIMIKKCSFTAGILLFWIIFFAGCAGGAEPREDEALYGEGGDIWYAVKSAEELAGEWEGSSVLDLPADESKGFPETVLNVSLSLSCAEGSAVQRITIAFGDFLEDLLAAHPDTALSADDLWEAYFENIYTDYILIKEDYALVIESPSPVEELLSGGSDKLYINQDGTRIREFVGGGLLEPFGVPGSIEFVLEKPLEN
jgi:hypothetical protein